MPMDRAAIETLLAGRRMLVFTANRRGGPEPFATPVWYLYRENQFLIVTGLDNAKALIVRRSPAVTLCVQDETWPYQAVLVRGTAELRPGRDAALVREIAVRYLGRAAGNDYADYNLAVTTEEGSATIVVTPVAWCAWDYADGWHPEVSWAPDAGLL